MAVKIEMKKVEEFKGFDPKEFDLRPGDWRYEMEHSYRVSSELMDQVVAAAKEVDGVCIAIVHHPTGDFVIGEDCTWGKKFVLFNAAVTYNRMEASFRGINYNRGKGALTAYSYDHFFKYEQGSIA